MNVQISNGEELHGTASTEQLAHSGKASIKERYRRMAGTDAFKKAYADKSIGEIIEIEE